ncbi:MAG: hypothetical protein R6T96_12480, partial [Longimicrobiales bacterium]
KLILGREYRACSQINAETKRNGETRFVYTLENDEGRLKARVKWSLQALAGGKPTQESVNSR